jgi:hypothetical protein
MVTSIINCRKIIYIGNVLRFVDTGEKIKKKRE